jgi:hypothetical protein
MKDQEHNLNLLAQATREESKDSFMNGDMISARELHVLADELDEEVRKLAMERVKAYGRAA